MEKLPVIYFDINEEDNRTGVFGMGFVTDPATETQWQLFSEQKQTFSRNEAERIVTGPIMLAETAIPRFDKRIGKYYSKFSADTIRKMRNKYFEQGYQNNVNEQHNPDRKIKDVYLVESYIINDRVTSELFQVPQGSWIGSWWIKDEKYWNDVIMKDKFTGLSLEGNFDYIPSTEMVYSAIEEIVLSERSDEEKYQLVKDIVEMI